MGYLGKITQFINDQLKERSFADKRFAGAEFFPLATIIPMQDDQGKLMLKLVALTQSGGTLCDDLIYDQNAPLRLFHIIRSSQWMDSAKDDFGDHIATKRVTSCVLMAFASRQLSMDPDDLELLIKYGLPVDLLRVPNYGDVKIIIEGVDYSQRQIFSEEFAIDNYTMEPDAVLVRVKYRLECVVNPDCVKILCC